jgi:hypothetical protein
MAQRNIDFGAFPDDPDADAIRSAFEKVQLNFTEVFAGLGDQAVVSVNRTAGPGIYLVNGSPVGNVVLGANISCVQVTSSSLQVTRDAPGNGSAGGSATITDATQTLYVDLPTSLANLTDISISGNLVASNVTANSNVTTANLTVTSSATMLVPLTVTTLTVTGNATASNFSVMSGNITAGNAAFGSNVTVTNRLTANLLTGNITTAAQPNITSVGTLTGLTVTSSTTTGNLYANVGVVQGQYLKGDGSNISSLTGANVTGQVGFAAVANSVAGGNVSGEVAFAATANAVAGSNVSGQVGNALVAGTVYTAAQPNITSVGTLTSLDASGNITAPNITANTGIFTGNGSGLSALNGANVTGEVAFAATANSVAGANVSGEVSNAATANAVAGANVSGEVAFAATANSVAGANVSGEVAFANTANNVAGANVSGEVAFANTANNVAGANVSGEVAFAATANAVSGANVGGAVANATHAVSADSATTAGTVTDNAQPNITSVGTLSSLDISGNLSAGNVAGANLVSANFIQGDGSLLTNIAVSAGSYIENGTSNAYVDTDANFRVSIGGTANVFTVSSTSANLNGTLNVSNVEQLTVLGTSDLGPVSNVTITGGVANAFLMTDGSGGLSFNTGTLLPAQGANTQIIFNDGGSTYAGSANLTFDKTTNTLSATKIAGTITTAAQPNITSLGSLSSLILLGNLNSNSDIITNAGNIQIAGGNGTFKGNGAGLTSLPGANVTGQVSFAATANAVAGANVSGEVAFAATANSVAGANVSGAVANATYANSAGTAGTVTTNAQPNITSVGTLTGLSVNGGITAANITANTGVFTGNGSGLSSLAGANVTGEVAFAATANAVAGANVSGQVGNALVAGTVYTNAQPNITSVGTLTSLGVSGNIVAANITANTGRFTGNGSGLSAIAGANVTGQVGFAAVANSVAGANVSGAVAFATTANAVAGANVTGEVAFAATANAVAGANVSGAVAFATTANAVAGANVSGTVANATHASTANTVTTAAQPNITSVGTLTSVTSTGNVSGANIIASSYHIRSVGTGISAAGTVQGNATAITKEISVVSTVATDAGVRLPTAVAGMVLNIVNTSANSLKVYPATGGLINTLATNAAFTQPAGGTLQFISTSATQWYTVGATYA